VSVQHTVARKSIFALFTLNSAQVFGHVASEHRLVCQNLVANAAGRGAQVKLKVLVAICSSTERLRAQAANEFHATFVNLSGHQCRPG
jgi:hypothetical protein